MFHIDSYLPYRYCHLKAISISILSSCHLVDRMTICHILSLWQWPNTVVDLATAKPADDVDTPSVMAHTPPRG